MTLAHDTTAQNIALRQWGIPECLHVPVAAVDEDALEKYVGKIVQTLSGKPHRRAFLIEIPEPPVRDARLPIWNVEGSEIFFSNLQVWVDVSYTPYRKAYQRGFPEEDIRGKVLSHCLNRRTAALKGYQFVRGTITTRGANSSSAFSENWGVDRYEKMEKSFKERRQGAHIQYADLTDLMLMLDIKLGGGIMDVVNEGQKLIKPTR